MRALRSRLFVCGRRRRAGGVRDLHLGFHCRVRGAGGGVRLPAALLGPRPVVAAADRAHDARAAAADQRRDDRAAIPSQGCRRAALGRLGAQAVTRLWWQSLLALAAFVTLIGLGTWQLERKAWKEGLIEALAERTNAQPMPLPAPERWAALDPAQDEFRRVAFAATIAPEREALVYSSGSSVRPDVSGPGYWVFVPAEFAGGGTVVVNRGFLPEGQQDRKTHMPPTGRVDLVGALRWPEPRGWFAPND